MKKIILTLIFALIISLNINAQYNKLSGIMTINGIKVTSFTNINYQLENDDVILTNNEDGLVAYASQDYRYIVTTLPATPTNPACVVLIVGVNENTKNYAMKEKQFYNYVVKTFKLKSVPQSIDDVDESYLIGRFENYSNGIVYFKEIKMWGFYHYKEE